MMKGASMNAPSAGLPMKLRMVSTSRRPERAATPPSCEVVDTMARSTCAESDDGQERQRVLAAAGQHPVIDLEHVERRGERQDAHDRAEQERARQQGPVRAYRGAYRIHGWRSGERLISHAAAVLLLAAFAQPKPRAGILIIMRHGVVGADRQALVLGGQRARGPEQPVGRHGRAVAGLYSGHFGADKLQLGIEDV